MSDQGSEHELPPTCSNGPCPSVPQLRLYQTVIFATPVFLTIVLLLLFCLLYLRRRRMAMMNSRIRAQFFTNAFFSPPREEGLSRSFRQRLPIVPFDEKFTKCREDTQCPVCLGDYQLKEKLQQLPLCGHTFHAECIDEWLVKNITCPICRTSLLQRGLYSPRSHEIANNQSSRWEDRVSNGHHDGSFSLRGVDAPLPLGEGSGRLSFTADTTLRISIEHAFNIERS